jgi:Ca-activated chloride channel family protein
LSDFNFNAENAENEAEITSLGLTYNLLTAYTSFIAVNDVLVNSQDQGEDVVQPLPLPLHASNLAVGGTHSSVPEPELYILLIMAAFLATVMVVVRGYQSR